MTVLDSPSGPRARSRRRDVLELITFVAGASIAWLLMVSLVRARPERKFEEFALGAQTQSRFASVDGFPIHCMTLADAQPCLDGHAARGGRPVVLWLGNSQLHAINQMKPGDQTAPEILHHLLDQSGVDVIAFSLPNANYQEMMVLFAYLSTRLPIRQLIVPLVFDDFREFGLRDGVAEGIDEPDVAKVLEGSDAGRKLLAEQSQQSNGGLSALEGTIQERSETFLNDWMEAHWKLWALRKTARGILITRLMTLRNSVFEITPQSKRRMIPGRFRRNLEALASLLEEARGRGIEVVAYIAPLRNDVPYPYVESEYESFKARVRQTVEERGAVFANLESLVPAKYWGLKDTTTIGGNAELDFMHFQGPGHELLAGAIRKLLMTRVRAHG